MKPSDEFDMKRQQALDALAEATKRLHSGQFWLAARRSMTAEGKIKEMITHLQTVLEINETSTLLLDSLADDKRIAGERALIAEALQRGDVEEITISGVRDGD